LILSRQLALIPGMFVLAGFSFAGSAGLALAAVLAGLSALLSAPWGEYCMFLRYRNANSGWGKYENRSLGDILGPFRACWLLTPFFLAALAGISLAGGIHPLLVVGEGVGYMGIFLFSRWVFSGRGDAQGHIRFTPVLIRKIPVKDLAFSRMMLPHVLSALLAALLPPLFPGLLPVGTSAFFGEDRLIPEAEYRAHAAFQSSFSYRALGSGGPGEPAYFRYVLGDDGLIAGEGAGVSLQEDIAPFPLEDLMNFLETGGTSSPGAGGRFTLMDVIPALAVFLFSVPAFIRPKWGDKNRKKRLLYKYKEKGIAA
jgi:hypothetical protein